MLKWNQTDRRQKKNWNAERTRTEHAEIIIKYDDTKEWEKNRPLGAGCWVDDEHANIANFPLHSMQCNDEQKKKEEAWIMDDLCDVRSYWAVHKAFMSWPRATLILVISLYLLFSYFCSCLFAFCSRLCPVWVCKFAGCWLCDEIEMTPCATVFLSLCKWLSKFI